MGAKKEDIDNFVIYGQVCCDSCGLRAVALWSVGMDHRPVMLICKTCLGELLQENERKKAEMEISRSA